MTVSSGFFNSKNGDRKYDALKVGELFDGLINDGVYETIYNQFHVRTYDNKRTLSVDTGRGWFHHTWVKNDRMKLYSLADSKSTYPRIDAVVIEVNLNHPVREDSIKVITGTESVTPERPSLVKGDGIYQYPLAYITVPGLSSSGQSNVTTSHITNMVGTSSCPFVTGVVKVMNIDMLVEQWGSQWKDMLNKWYIDYALEFNEWAKDRKYEFLNWFKDLQVMLDGDVAENLAKEILRIDNFLDTLARERRIYQTVLDSNHDPILDDRGDPIGGDVYFAPTGAENVIYVKGSGTADVEPISDSSIDSIFDD